MTAYERETGYLADAVLSAAGKSSSPEVQLRRVETTFDVRLTPGAAGQLLQDLGHHGRVDAGQAGVFVL